MNRCNLDRRCSRVANTTYYVTYWPRRLQLVEGELIVEVPRDVTFQEDEEDAEDSSNLSDPQDEDEHDEETEVGTHKEQKLVLDAWDLDRLPKSSTGYKAVVVRVEYDIDEPSGGLRDTLRDACTFRIELTVPDWCVAVCSGQMVQQVLNPEVDADGVQWRTFRYVVNPKTNCSSIGFAVGPFRLYVPPEMPRMTHFALPECFEDLVHCTSKLASTMTYFERALGASYPFKTYQQVFVEDLPDQLQYIAGGAVLDQNLLHGPRIIDRELPSHLAQVKALVGSWIGGAVGIQSTKDAWVLIGVIGHLVNTYVRSIYDEEEYGYRIQLAMDALTTIELTTDQQSPALHSSEVDVYSEYDPLSLTLLEVKAPLVLHMIEQRVGPKHLSIAIQRAVSGGGAGATNGTSGGGDASAPNGDGNKDEEASKANDDKKSGGRDGDDDGGDTGGESVNAGAAGKPSGDSAPSEPLTTLSFLKTVKTIAGASGQDLTKAFLTSWIVEPGMPFLTVGYWYNRKQTQAEVVLQQEIPPGGKLYTGPISITIVEDTSEYSYQKRIEHKRHKFDSPCHSKVRKKRRKRQGLADPDDSVSVGGPGMGLNDTPEDRHRLCVVAACGRLTCARCYLSLQCHLSNHITNTGSNT
uniref:Transcription initiation factor TFIID subunit 2 n=1 Tax=Phytophthora ramorum TaxID=164328 RepID=H3H7Q4_PHYRM